MAIVAIKIREVATTTVEKKEKMDDNAIKEKGKEMDAYAIEVKK